MESLEKKEIKCPKCGSDVTPHEVNIIFGYNEGHVDILAAGDMNIAFCCGNAILYKQQKELIVHE